MISIVIPCYNCEKTFKKCIGSIRNQTYYQIEIILVDDGSTDHTYELCEKAVREDTRIKVIHQKNSGLMNAWKNGVRKASGEYIVFCDSDDYIDDDLVETLTEKIRESQADIIIYGMIVEYSDNMVDYVDNRLMEGLYLKEDIAKFILPQYFDNGRMQSEIIIASRDTKMFRRELLMRIIDDLNDEIAVGEDDLTTFSAVLSADSIYCINQFYPYHYVRSDESMIGKYDMNMFDQLLILRKELIKIASNCNYLYMEQIEKYFISNVLLCMKKEICRNQESGYRKVRHNIIRMRENPIFINAISKVEIRNYEVKSRIFAELVIRKRYLILYVMTNIMSSFGIGKP